AVFCCAQRTGPGPGGVRRHGERDQGAGTVQEAGAWQPANAHCAGFGLRQGGSQRRSCARTGRVSQAKAIREKTWRTVTGARVLYLMSLVAFLAWAAPRRDCATCHRPQELEQPATGMGRALESVASCDILRANPKLVFRAAGYSYQLVRDGDRSIYSVTDGKDTITVPIAW